MRYDFQVKPEVYKLFVDDKSDEDIISLKKGFKTFRITYSTDSEDANSTSLLDILEGISDYQQILLWGIKEDNSKYVLAYWLVGDGYFDDEKEDYEKAIKAFETIQRDYKIE